ncbi:MAG: carnitinyl-CoA dehydratase, partial [Rhodospirillaceae bacterium]|nr:carnitinyl-CoA dehydratase [Rhodospirillaceae bacterium]
MSDAVQTERRGKVLEVTLNRPPVNAIDAATSMELYEAFRMLQDDDSLTVGIMTGDGDRCFSAGWDLKAVAAAESLEDIDVDESPGGFAGLTEFWDLHKPVIGAINGMTIGGGFELALSTDILIAVDWAEFWLPEMERGFLASAGAIQRLPRRIPYDVAMDLFLTGRHMSAQEA